MYFLSRSGTRSLLGGTFPGGGGMSKFLTNEGGTLPIPSVEMLSPQKCEKFETPPLAKPPPPPQGLVKIKGPPPPSSWGRIPWREIAVKRVTPIYFFIFNKFKNCFTLVNNNIYWQKRFIWVFLMHVIAKIFI